MLFKSLLPLSVMLFSLNVVASEAVITLDNGDQLTAEFVKQDDTHSYLNHPVLGELIIANDKISELTAVTETEEVAAAEPVIEVAEAEPEAPKDNGLFGMGILQDWKRRFDLGIAGSAGRNENNQVNAGFTADFEDEYQRISSKSSYYRSESNGNLSNHNFYTALNKDWLLEDSPWLLFAAGRFDIDEFKDWDYRLNADGGIGYEFINNDSFLFVGKAGLGFNQTFGEIDDEFTPEGSLGIESKWTISDYQSVKFANTYYPNLDDFSQFRNVTSLDWLLDLNTIADIGLKLGLSNEHDSTVDTGVDKNDFKYTVSLAWTL